MAETARLAKKLRSEGEKLLAFFESIPDDRWTASVYIEGPEWTVRDTLAHLVTTERAYVTLFEQIRRGGGGVSEDFVIDRYNAAQQRKTADLHPRDLLSSFREERARMVAWVSGLDPSDLERRGRHPYLGVTTLRDMLKLVSIHSEVHRRDMRRVLNPPSGRVDPGCS